MQTDSQRLYEQFSREMKALEGVPLVIETTALEGWMVLSHLQLALRHPDNHGHSAKIVENFARKLQAVIAPEGAMHEIAERGWAGE